GLAASGGGTAALQTFTGANGNLVLAAPVTYTGPTTVGAGNLTLSGNGALNQTAALNQVETLFFPTYTSNIVEGDDTGGTFTLNYLGANGAASTETLGTVLFNTGHSTIQTTAGSGTGSSVLLTANTIGRNAGATVNLVAGGSQILGTAANQLIINVPAAALLT